MILYYMFSLKNILIITVCVIALNSCREEIISPDNIAGNVNEPVKMNTYNSYSFLINAENISSTVTDSSPFTGLKMSCYVTIVDYNSGSVQITVSGKFNYLLFQETFASNISSFANVLEGNSPEYIQLKFRNFSGKLRFELNKL